MDVNRAKQIYNILNGINTALLNMPGVSTIVIDGSWQRFNTSLDELQQGYSDEVFLDFKIVPQSNSQAGQFVKRTEYTSKVFQATLYLHNQYMSHNTTPPQETAYNNPGLVLQQNASQTQSQGQSQVQEQTQNMEQSVGACIKNIEEHYGEEHANTAKELLGNLSKEPSKWSNIQKILNFSANLGKEAFVAVLPVLTQALLLKKK